MGMNPKQRAAEAALAYIRSDTVIGLGTGSTADCFLVALAAALREGRLKNVRGIPTSRNTERRAQHLGIPTVTFAESPHVSVDIDGADEIGPGLNLIKGLGGALLREKIVAQNCEELIIIADASKRVNVLGTRSPLPVEVAQFGWVTQEKFLRSLGCEPRLRRTTDGGVFVTDNGNQIYDCRFPRIDNPAALERMLKSRAGIIETGLFTGIAKRAIIADDNGVQEITS